MVKHQQKRGKEGPLFLYRITYTGQEHDPGMAPMTWNTWAYGASNTPRTSSTTLTTAKGGPFCRSLACLTRLLSTELFSTVPATQWRARLWQERDNEDSATSANGLERRHPRRWRRRRSIVSTTKIRSRSIVVNVTGYGPQVGAIYAMQNQFPWQHRRVSPTAYEIVEEWEMDHNPDHFKELEAEYRDEASDKSSPRRSTGWAGSCRPRVCGSDTIGRHHRTKYIIPTSPGG